MSDLQTNFEHENMQNETTTAVTGWQVEVFFSRQQCIGKMKMG